MTVIELIMLLEDMPTEAPVKHAFEIGSLTQDIDSILYDEPNKRVLLFTEPE